MTDHDVDTIGKLAITAIGQQKLDASQIGPENVPYVVLPEGWTAHSFEGLAREPLRKRGGVTLLDLPSFLDTVKRHAYGSTVIYVSTAPAPARGSVPNGPISAVAVFNDHGMASAGWRDHTATFEPIQSAEWAQWNHNNGQQMDQQTFAMFIERNLRDVVKPEGFNVPTAADMLEFVTKLFEVRKVKYGSAINTQSGMVQLEYTENDGAGQRQNLEMYREFVVALRPLVGGDAYQVKAFLRYRINRDTGAISFWYELQRPELVVEAVCQDVIAKIREAQEGVQVVMGYPK